MKTLVVLYIFVLFTYHEFAIRAQRHDEGAPPEIPNTTESTQASKGLCECGAFDTTTPTSKDCPIIKHSPLEVTCDEEGAETCNQLCKALAEASREQAPVMLCEKLHHHSKLKATVHSRTCETGPWRSAGLTSDEICCHSYKPIDCLHLHS